MAHTVAYILHPIQRTSILLLSLAEYRLLPATCCQRIRERYHRDTGTASRLPLHDSNFRGLRKHRRKRGQHQQHR